MIVLGLTGSIGMGKSTAASMLRELGVPVHDSDDAVHRLLGPGGKAVDAVAARFPEAYDPDRHAINRKTLGGIVFQDAEKRKTLEDIVHPLVRQDQQEFLSEHQKQNRRIVALDIPLLYETGAESRVDKVIVVTCPACIQRRRVLARPGMTEEKFASILAGQIPDAEKRRRADFTVQTGLGRAYSYHRLKKIIQHLSRDQHHDPQRHHLPPHP